MRFTFGTHAVLTQGNTSFLEKQYIAQVAVLGAGTERTFEQRILSQQRIYISLI